ncbi:hypothetical protein PGTUg99_037765 [Puccinia graminis f. sp. tritici]|uniref:Uncharacterized protein n=1 Tax=Puccinia graminis f. sp. tritici TaxID=56615 RepID=A0A5B0RA65_PUCGR|nr:hypothetical protein PGTUg99_037765 [Puccinia graminis f. sp. tritici]
MATGSPPLGGFTIELEKTRALIIEPPPPSRPPTPPPLQKGCVSAPAHPGGAGATVGRYTNRSAQPSVAKNR